MKRILKVFIGLVVIQILFIIINNFLKLPLILTLLPLEIMVLGILLSYVIYKNKIK